MRAIGRDEVQLYSPPRLSEPFPHDLRVMIACVVEKDMDEDQHRIERLDRFQKPDRRGGVDGFDLDHSGLTGLEIDRAMDVDALAPTRLLDPGADLARRAWQRRRDPGLQVFLLLAVHLAGAATGLERVSPSRPSSMNKPCHRRIVSSSNSKDRKSTRL